MINNYFPWTYNISFDDDRAWCVSSRGNMLLELDLQNEKISLVCEFSDVDDFKPRQYHAYCLKYDGFILCAPVRSNYFWLYDLKRGFAQKINCDVDTMVCVGNMVAYGEKIFVVAQALGEVLEINAKGECLCKHYPLMKDENVLIQDSVVVKNTIYCLSSLCDADTLCEFDMNRCEIKCYKLPAIGDRVYSFCFDGEYFWLGGCKRKLYIWRIETGDVQILDFSAIAIGRYDFENDKDDIIDFELDNYKENIFFRIIATEQYIWCFPFRTDTILYIDKTSKEVKRFYIKGEEESRASLSNREVELKYVVEYVRQERYIGLYSAKQNRLIEIDTVLLTYEIKNYRLDDSVLQAMERKSFSHVKLFNEGNKSEYLDLFINMLRIQKNKYNNNAVSFEIGKLIYESIT